METELRRAAFFDLGSCCRSVAGAVVSAIETHRRAGDLLILVLPDDRVPPHPYQLGLRMDLMVYAKSARTPEDINQPSSLDSAKLQIVVETMARLGLDASRCFAYGHRSSGLGTLAVVGNPRVIAPDPELTRYARSRGWPLIDAPRVSPETPSSC
ncbi:HAD family hydrolase [Kitasatospora sp. NPDC001175]|uniref:hypothetical protein n=1 Tax=Kitasatospora sp. NPDC001175 TaxID=3157103 RepID=UPI003CFDEBD2